MELMPVSQPDPFQPILSQYDLVVKFFHYKLAQSSRLNCGVTAEDLAQQVMIKAIRGYGNFRGSGAKVSTWLYRISFNVFLSHLRSIRFDPIKSAEDIIYINEPNSEDDTLARISRDRDAKRLLSEISKLPKIHRECLLLRVRGYKMKDIARELGIKKINTVKSRINRAKKILRKRFAIH